jgi:hypothetical protein
MPGIVLPILFHNYLYFNHNLKYKYKFWRNMSLQEVTYCREHNDFWPAEDHDGGPGNRRFEGVNVH